MNQSNVINFFLWVLFYCTVFSGSLVSANDDDSRYQRERKVQAALEYQEALDQFNIKMVEAIKTLEKRTQRETTKLNFSVSRAPQSIAAYSPVHFRPFQGISIELLSVDPVLAGSRHLNFATFMRAFNIQVATRNQNLDWPDKATMVFNLTRFEDEVVHEVELHRIHDGSTTYVLHDPIGVLQKIQQGISELSQLQQDRVDPNYGLPKPVLNISYLTGFKSVVAQAFDEGYPVGVPITYSFRIGETRLESGDMYLGRPREFTSIYPQKEFLR